MRYHCKKLGRLYELSTTQPTLDRVKIKKYRDITGDLPVSVTEEMWMFFETLLRAPLLITKAGLRLGNFSRSRKLGDSLYHSTISVSNLKPGDIICVQVTLNADDLHPIVGDEVLELRV